MNKSYLISSTRNLYRFNVFEQTDQLEFIYMDCHIDISIKNYFLIFI